MVLKTYFQEIALYTNYQTKAYSAPFSASDNEYQFIFKSMGIVGTDVQNGGTGFTSVGMNSFLGQCGVTVDNTYPGNQQYMSPYADPAQYKYGMPIGWLSIMNPNPFLPGHLLAIDGVEGSYYKVFDPWGAVYNTTLNSTATTLESTISFVNGDSSDCIEFFGGSPVVFGIQWVQNYVAVQGAPPPNGVCQ